MDDILVEDFHEENDESSSEQDDLKQLLIEANLKVQNVQKCEEAFLPTFSISGFITRGTTQFSAFRDKVRDARVEIFCSTD